MKQSSIQAKGMTTFLFVVAVFSGPTVSATGNAPSDGTMTSVLQIKDTLQNLLRSIDDAQQDAGSLLDKRQRWCKSSLSKLSSANKKAGASVLEMQGQLTETEAQVEEAKGTVQQVKVDIEMVQYTIKQTEDMLSQQEKQEHPESKSMQLMNSLVDNKQLSLKSLRGELDVAVPVLSHLQADVAELKQRLSTRTESLEAGNGFMIALSDGCQDALHRSDSQSDVRTHESNSIRASLQGLLGLIRDENAEAARQGEAVSIHAAELNLAITVAEKRTLIKRATPSLEEVEDPETDEALSFVQLHDQTEESPSVDDLTDLFSEQHTNSAPVEQVPQPIAGISSSSVHVLLNQLGSTALVPADQEAWCAQQRSSGELALKFSKDSVAQVNTEVASHVAAGAQMAEELRTMQVSADVVKDSAKTFSGQAAKEKALAQSGRKDQVLATKILVQVRTILQQLDTTHLANVVGGLSSAHDMFVAQMEADTKLQWDASLKEMAIEQKAIEFATVMERETHNLEFAKDDHESQRLQGVENKRLYEADVQESAAYLQKLEETCKENIGKQESQQKSVEILALEDANKALSGTLSRVTEEKAASGSLRGLARPKPEFKKNMTPMQRAAMEMGLPFDG